jgi:hypothetical protein
MNSNMMVGVMEAAGMNRGRIVGAREAERMKQYRFQGGHVLYCTVNLLFIWG